MVYRPESIQRRLEKLTQYGGDLSSLLPADYRTYVTDRRTKYAVERLLLLITETLLDALDHILSAYHGVVSDEYEEILWNAHARELLPAELHRKLEGIGGFRNVLAHEYLALRDEEVYAHAKRIRDLLPAIRAELEAFLEEH